MCQMIQASYFRGYNLTDGLHLAHRHVFFGGGVLITDNLPYSFALAANISPGHFKFKKSGFLARFEKA